MPEKPNNIARGAQAEAVELAISRLYIPRGVTTMTEREKTLKEKVEEAKKCLDEQLDSLEQHKYGVVAVRKALTALEERVAELEKERDMNRLDYLKALYDRDGMFCESELYAEMVGLQNRKEAPTDGK